MSEFTDTKVTDYDNISSSTKGELFEPSFWPGGIVTSRNWHISTDDPKIGRRTITNKILFRHGTVTGLWLIVVDGVPILKGTVPVTTRKFSISFKFKEEDALISADGTDSINFGHKLEINNNFQIEMRNVNDTGFISEDIPDSILITDTRAIVEDDKSVIFYQVYVKTKRKQHTIVEKRYSQFDILDSCIRSSVRKHIAGGYYDLCVLYMLC